MHTTISVGDFFTNYFSTFGNGSHAYDSITTTTGGTWYPKQTEIVPEAFNFFIREVGTPWDSIDSKFPPFDVLVNRKTGELKFRFALSGVDPDTVNVEFADERLWLIIDPQEKPVPEDWDILKQKIKQSVNGRYYYPVSTDKFDVKNASGNWEKGILEITIPLNKEKKPHKLAIKK